MQINFMQLLQDSWNFMRNQRQFSIWAIGITLIVQFAITNINVPIPDISQTNATQIDLTTFILPTVIISITNTFLTGLIILNIDSINNGTFKHFFTNITTVFSFLFGLIILSVVSILPLSIGSTLIILQPQNPTFFLPFIVIGFYFLIKFYLVFYVYLTETPRKSIKETLLFTFKLSRQKTLPLILLILLTSFVPSVLVNAIEKVTVNISFIIPIFISTLFNVFTTVLVFRFYQIYRQK